MAFFKKKKPEGGSNGDSGEAFEPQPEKARKWFEHAKTAAMSSNYAYAIECYANGIRLDPEAMSAHVSMREAALGYMSQGAKPASGKEIKGIDDGTPIGKLAAAEFEWMKDLKNFKTAVKALDAAVKADLLELGHWLATRGGIYQVVRSQKKLTKSMLLQAMELFRQVGAWDESMMCGQLAHQLDPADGDLDAQLKNLSAQRAMDQGGYDQAAGEEGGFRKFIKDADKQQELIEEGSLAGGGSIEERNLVRARVEYEKTPELPDVVNRYAQLLKKEATPAAEGQSRDIYLKAFEETGEYRFRMSAGDIEIEWGERRLRELDQKLEDGAATPDVQTERDQVHKELLDLKSTEYVERVKRYPTDRVRKFQLGTVHYELQEYGEAMAHFQAAKDEPKLRVRAGQMLGRCFLAEEWFAEAISEFEESLQVIEVTDKERELSIRYDLMLALVAGARQEQSIDMARQAKAICSEIARKDITYRDIRAKRGEVDKVIKELDA